MTTKSEIIQHIHPRIVGYIMEHFGEEFEIVDEMEPDLRCGGSAMISKETPADLDLISDGMAEIIVRDLEDAYATRASLKFRIGSYPHVWYILCFVGMQVL